MKTWLIVFTGLAITWHYMDIASDRIFYSALLPFLFFICLITAVIKLAVKFGGSSASGYGGDGGFGGGDSGGGGDC